MRRRNEARGFTIVEVTLAIVIGIILIAGATLIYNQAKQAAGNSRAQAKVASMQGLVEQFASRTDGVAPDITAVRMLWEKARNDDFNKSPWGGNCIPCTDANGTQTSAVIGQQPTKGVLDGNSLSPDNTDLANTLISNPSSGGSQPPDPSARGPSDASYQGEAGGIMIYYQFPDARMYGIWDETRRDVVWGRSYGVAITNAAGERWYFVSMNRAGGAGGNPLNVQGQIGN